MSCTVKSHPRIPYGMRPVLAVSVYISISISIHAPLTGCDNALDCFETYCLDFNPRTPYGMRQQRLY